MVYVAGTGSMAADVVEIVLESGIQVTALIELQDETRVGLELHGLPVIALEPPPNDEATVILGTGADRTSVSQRLADAGWRFATLVHPRAHVPRSVQLGAGTLVAPGAIISCAVRTGDHALLGRCCTIGHHTVLGDVVTIHPGVRVAGNSEIGDGVFIGIGAVVRDHVRIGAGAVVAAGAVVVADVPAGAEVRGVPARPVERAAG